MKPCHIVYYMARFLLCIFIKILKLIADNNKIISKDYDTKYDIILFFNFCHFWAR